MREIFIQKHSEKKLHQRNTMRLGTPYARNQKQKLEQVKARQRRLGDAYLVANKLQMRRNRRKRRDRGQVFLPLDLK